MRKRNVRKQFYLSEEENMRLKRKSIETGLTESNIIRCLIDDFHPKAKEPKEYYEVLKLLRNISNNMNQVAMKVHTYNYIDEEVFFEQVKKLNDFIKKYKSDSLNIKSKK